MYNDNAVKGLMFYGLLREPGCVISGSFLIRKKNRYYFFMALFVIDQRDNMEKDSTN